MNRLQFLKALGLSGNALMVVLTACQREEVAPVGVVGPVDFELDLMDPITIPLARVGGYVVQQGVVIARTKLNQFVAVTQTCSHEGLKQITFRYGQFYCTAHGARFDENGRGLNQEGKRGLKVYKTALTGNRLRIYS
jgi:cytochrome b6-f complex iron-sulfur subunit